MKISSHVSFENFFYVSAADTYHLRSVIVHHGDAGGGHYTAYVRADDNHWYHCNDAADPQLTNSHGVLQAEAYPLIYEKRE